MCDLVATERKLEQMPREEFQEKVMKGVASSYEFSKLVIGGPQCLIKSDWRKIYADFVKLGMPKDLAPSEAYELAKFIAKKTFES